MPFDERSRNLATLAVESIGRLGEQGSDLIDQVEANGEYLARKGVGTKRIFTTLPR